MYGRNGKSLGQTWNDLLIENETVQLTDDQLKSKVYEAFPDSHGKTTVERVGMIRSDYNAGRGLFNKFGPAGSSPARPRSLCYGKGKAKAKTNANANAKSRRSRKAAAAKKSRKKHV